MELQDMISTRVEEAMKERHAVHALSREVHDFDLLVQVPGARCRAPGSGGKECWGGGE